MWALALGARSFGVPHDDTGAARKPITANGPRRERPMTTPLCNNINYAMNRRDFLGRFGLGLGGAALASLLNRDARAGSAAPANAGPLRGVLGAPHVAPKARRIIYLFMSGGPSQLDLFDHKPLLNKMQGQDLPAGVR